MIVSAHQPAYLPWLGFVHKLICSDVFVIMDDVQFEKNSFSNRNKILQNGKEVMLTIPLNMKGHFKKSISEMTTANLSWQKKHNKSIIQSYARSPYLADFKTFLNELYTLDSNRYIDYCDKCLEMIIKYLNLDTRIVKASELDISSKKNEYIIELTKKLNGEIFIFGENGKNYADLDKMKKNKIIPYFQKYVHPVYNQLADGFHPLMTVFDLFFNESLFRVREIIMQGNPGKDQIRALITK